ncbi:hypothetical protein KCV87_07295 [Actinosynnema pretiosum subsp. pretiosum]|uniref:Uncharacterized protein n=1 Tax=Actinosynnema pretiosum subsp. pretiosum TaxID=103721 RepID=A0AA45LA55_9PSEU|nr:hypothetical protein APASM_2569 [Actinosynnema pretiosum subsp. pretiosum]QUF05873.1 hypothetical protein KCV87_07295 [Actinosynnema pretiosum subsp. pretiosum]
MDGQQGGRNAFENSSADNVVQAGTVNGGVHVNSTPPPLANLTPQAAAAQLVAMRTGEAADALAAFPYRTALLTVLLADHEATTIGLLGDMELAVARDLVDALPSPPDWLGGLLTASEGFGNAALGPARNKVRRAAPSPQGSTGFSRDYDKGRAYWSADTLFQTVVHPFLREHDRRGGTGGELGFPVGERAWNCTDDTPGGLFYQRFEGGVIYESSPPRVVRDPDLALFDRFGFPTGDETGLGTFFADQVKGTFQPFERGTAYWVDNVALVREGDSSVLFGVRAT